MLGGLSRGRRRTATSGPSEVAIAWRFADRGDARAFLRELFGLRAETRPEVLEAALDELGLVESEAGCDVPWTMVFASAAA